MCKVDRYNELAYKLNNIQKVLDKTFDKEARKALWADIDKKKAEITKLGQEIDEENRLVKNAIMNDFLTNYGG